MLGVAGPSGHLEFLHRIEIFIQLDRLDFLILQMHDQMLTIYGISHWILYEDLMPASLCITSETVHILIDLLLILVVGACVRRVIKQAEIGRMLL